MVVDVLGDIRTFEPHRVRLLIEPFHLAVQSVSHQFERDVRVAIDTRRLALLGKEMEDLVDVGHVEVATQAEVLGSPVVAAQEGMHILQSALPCGGIAQMAHKKGCTFPASAGHSRLRIGSSLLLVGLWEYSEHFRNGVLALSPFTKHIFLASRGVEVDASHSGTLLTAVVLFLHHQVELVQPIAPGSVFLLVITQWLQQANHRHSALMFQLFHFILSNFADYSDYSEHALINDINNGCGCSTVDEYSGWNCVPIYHFLSGISTISTRSVAGLMPTHFMPAASYSSL